MKPFSAAILATALLAGCAIPAQAQSLLGVVGSPDSGAVVTLGSGEAGTSGTVNVGLGGGGGNIVDANVGNGSVSSANVSSGSDGGLGANVGLLNNTATVDVGVGGGGGLLNVDIGVGGGGNGNNGGNGNGGANGGNGNNGGNGGTVFRSNGGGFSSTSGGGIGAPNCTGISDRDLERLLQSTRIDGSWSRASGVNLQRVALCPAQRSWLASALPGSPIGQQLQAAIIQDALVSASLNRASFGPERVIAVRRDGSQLTVYVY